MTQWSKLCPLCSQTTISKEEKNIAIKEGEQEDSEEVNEQEIIIIITSW